MIDVGRANGFHGTWQERVLAPLVAEPEHKHVRVVPVEQSAPQAGRGAVDVDLKRDVRRSGWMRQGFYVVVLLTALAGQVSGATEKLHIPLLGAIPATAALELGGVVVMANADVRRRLGESAVFSRILSALIAAWAVAFNWLAHADHLLGGFFAGMSALGYLVWLMHVENQRRDRLRATGDLPPVPPKYELWTHWLMHPAVTLRARSLAKESQSPGRTPLDLYASLDAARNAIRDARRTRALSAVIERQIRASGRTPTEAEIALTTYDMDEIAERVRAHADYARLAELIAAQIHPDAVAGAGAPGAEKAQVEPTPGASVGAPAGAVEEPFPEAPECARQTHLHAVADAPPGAPGESHRPRPSEVAKRARKSSATASPEARLRALAARTGGPVSVRRAMTELGVGAPKAKEYLRAVGLLEDIDK